MIDDETAGQDPSEETQREDEALEGFDEPTKDSSPSPPQDVTTPSEVPERELTAGTREADIDPDDIAPDADDDGDDLPEPLQDVVHEGEVKPDNVDTASEGAE